MPNPKFRPGDRVRVIATGEFEAIDSDYGPKVYPRYAAVSGRMYADEDIVFASHHPPLRRQGLTPEAERERRRVAAEALESHSFPGRYITDVGGWIDDGPDRIQCTLVDNEGLRATFIVVFPPDSVEIEDVFTYDWYEPRV